MKKTTYLVLISLIIFSSIGWSLRVIAATYDPMVEKAQKQLTELGYEPGPIDGKMGKKTENAIKSFQRDNNLEISGTLDEKTLQKLGLVPQKQGELTIKEEEITPEPETKVAKEKKEEFSYEDLKIFSEVVYLLQTNYVEPTKMSDLIFSAVKGMEEEVINRGYNKIEVELDWEIAKEADNAKKLSERYEAFKPLVEAFKIFVDNTDIPPKELINTALKGMMKALDPYSSIIPSDSDQDSSQTSGEIGCHLTIRDEQLVVIAPLEGAPAFRAGIQTGDIILKIGNTPAKTLSLMEAMRLLRGPVGKEVTLTIMRDGFKKSKDFTMVREILEVKRVSSRMLDNDIGYVRLGELQKESADELEETLKELEESGMKALILDLRNNPGGLLNTVVEVADKFLEKGKLIVYTEGRKKNQDMRFVAHDDFTHPNYPMIVLINHGTISGSEILASALQAHQRALIVGRRSYGLGSIRSSIPLSDGLTLTLTTAYFFTPAGHNIHQQGIIPDVVVESKENDVLKLAHDIIKKTTSGHFDDLMAAAQEISEEKQELVVASGMDTQEALLEQLYAQWEQLNSQVETLYQQEQYAEATEVAEEALNIARKTFDPDHLNVGQSLYNLAKLYQAQNQYTEAEPLYKQALSIKEKALGLDHPDVATIVENLAILYSEIGDTEGATGLMVAIGRGDISIVKLLLQHNADTKRQAKDAATLIVAVKKGRAEFVKILIEYGADVNMLDEKDRTMLMLAAAEGHTNIVKLLLEHNIDVNAKDVKGETALIVAVKKGWSDLVKILLEHDADVNMRDKNYRTPLMLAAAEGHINVVKLLLKHDVDVTAKDKDNNTALMYAEAKGHPEVVQMLRAKIDPPKPKIQGPRVTNDEFVVAATFGRIETVRKALEQGADANARMKDSPILLMVSLMGHIDIVKLLIEHGADIEARHAVSGITPLMAAASSGKLDVVKLLIARGAKVEAKNESGGTALMVAASKEQFKAVEFLLEQGADIDARYNNGGTALLEAVENGKTDMVRLLLKYDADVNAKDQNDLTALMIAAIDGRTEIAKQLLEHGADINAVLKSGHTALIGAAMDGHTDVVKLLLEHGADVKVKTNDGQSALMFAEIKGHTEIVRILKAALIGQAERGEQLSKMEISEEERDRLNNNLLVAINYGNVEMVKKALYEGADINARNSERDTALVTAAFRGHTEVVNLLLEQGADIETKVQKGATALTVATLKGYFDIVRLLVEHGADITTRVEDGRDLLMAAAYSGNSDITQFLIEKGADMDLTDNNGLTALMMASQNGHTHVVKTLLAHNSEVNVQNSEGETALIWTARRGYDEIAQLLVEHGADVNLKTQKGETALMSSVLNGHANIAKLLIDYQADVNAQVNEGQTALMGAAFNGDLDIVRLLLDHNAEIEVKDNIGMTALLSAILKGHTGTVKLLIDKGADVNISLNSGQTALMLAESDGYTEIVRLLKEAGAQ